jgi:RNA polymerase sigma-70 factor (ECF subfamily)
VFSPSRVLTERGEKHYWETEKNRLRRNSRGEGCASLRFVGVKDNPERISGEALERLLADRKLFLSFLEKRVESREIAEDLLQTAFVRGIERGGQLRDNESVVAWFYRMLRNAVIDHYRHNAVHSRAVEQWIQELDSQEVPSPDLRDEVCECVMRLMSELKPEYREALQIVDVDETSVKEFGKQSGITANNAAVRVHRAREALRKQVQLTCGVCAEHGCVDCRCAG